MLDFLIITLVLCLITFWLQSRPFIWKGKGIAWKVGFPLFGNSPTSLFKPFHESWSERYSQIGDEPLLGCHFFSTPALILKDPRVIKKVMISDADHFLEREIQLNENDPIGKSVLFTGGMKWKSQRTLMNPYFSPSRIKAMVAFLHPITERFAEYLVDESKKGPVDVLSSCHKLSSDAVMSIVFGLQPDSFDNPNSYFYSVQKEMMSFGMGFRAMLAVMLKSIFRLLNLKLFSERTNSKMTQFVLQVIDQRCRGIGVREDIMQGLIEVMEKEDNSKDSSSSYNPDNSKLTKLDKETVVGQCMVMFLAGTETTANSLCFLLYELAMNQDIQTKLRNEINCMLKKSSGEYGYEDLNKLSYMNKVISETLRKYPIVAVIGRKCTKPYNLDGLEVPVGTVVSVPILGIHRDENNFPEPMNFDPERFSPECSIIPGTYLPFGLGPRTCIGMKLAMTEIVLAVCKILPKYQLVPSVKTVIPVKYSNHPTLSSDKSLWIDIKPIG